MHQEGQISRIPKLVRGITMREFRKYEGDIQAALRGLQQAKFEEGPFGVEIDKDTRKRKWAAIQEAENHASGSGSAEVEAEPSKAAKNGEIGRSSVDNLIYLLLLSTARLAERTPKKKPGSSTGPGTIQRTQLLLANRTPGTVRTTTCRTVVILDPSNPQARTMGRPGVSPSPRKFRYPSNNLTRPTSRHPSPSKPGVSLQFPKTRSTRPPSSATFNPALPTKAPAYPNPRLPRLNESMLSVNGSPLANPYDLGMGWFRTRGDIVENGNDGEVDIRNGKPRQSKERTVKNANRILVRHDSSFVVESSGTTNGFHFRTDSQTSFASSHAAGLSQTNSQTSLYAQTHPSQSKTSQLDPTTDPPLPGSALVAIPTKDGHLLEFDPLLTSPRALDALEGITNSSKKQAREDMGRLVQAAVDKWKM